MIWICGLSFLGIDKTGELWAEGEAEAVDVVGESGIGDGGVADDINAVGQHGVFYAHDDADKILMGYLLSYQCDVYVGKFLPVTLGSRSENFCILYPWHRKYYIPQ